MQRTGMLDHAGVEPEPPSRTERLRAVVCHDLPASLVVFLVALPLSLGIAIASDAPVLAGLTAAIVGGIVAGFLGGSPLQVSGPAAGLTVVVADLVSQFGWAVTCLITAFAGVLQVLLGLSRVARAALAISPVVVHAMLAGIGITIALQQMHVLLGGKSKSTAWQNVVGLPGQIVDAHRPGVILGMLVIAVLVGWHWAPAGLRRVPGPLVAIVAVTVISVVFPFHVTRIRLEGSVLDAVRLPELPDGNWGAVAMGVLTVTLITSVQSLLTAVSIDRMHNGPRTDFDRELIGLGVANVAAGAIGGLPVSGVIVRSAANVNAGAKTRASTIMHGFWILLFTIPFAGLVEEIPTAALAGLLIVVGAQLLKPAHIETALRNGDLAVYVVTTVSVVFLNLLHGVMIGLALAIGLTGWRVIRARIEVAPVGDEWHVVVEGACTFLALPRLTRVLGSVPQRTTVTVSVLTDYLDHAAQQAISDWQHQHRSTGGTVHIDIDTDAGAPPAARSAANRRRARLTLAARQLREQT